MSALRVAAAQFPVGADVEHNLGYVRRLVEEARGARLVLFPETALCGYAGWDLPTLRGYDWETLEAAQAEVAEAARRAGVWVVYGTMVRVGRGKPRNSLVVVDPSGAEVARYDKRLLTMEDRLAYAAGDAPVVVDVEGTRCGLAICHEWRYPEVYRQYHALGAEAVLQGWYDGGYAEDVWQAEGRAQMEVLPATVQGHAVCNRLWIVGANTSKPRSCFAAFVVRPDGTVAARGVRHRAGVVHATLAGEVSVDHAAHLRRRVMRGGLG